MVDYYVDSINGLDTNSGLSLNDSYKTLQALLNSKTAFTENTTIYLQSGIYVCEPTIVTKIKENITLTVIGLNHRTQLKPSKPWGSGNSSIGTKGATLSLNKMILDMTSMGIGGDNAQYTSLNMNINNILFTNIPFTAYSTFFPNGSTYIIKNCIAIGQNDIKLRQFGDGSIQLYNCYGRFQNGANTSQEKWDIENNVITITPQIDDNYRITQSGVNRYVGLFYGYFNWGDAVLLKKNNQYYSIDIKQYNLELKEYTPLSSLDFEKDGFNSWDLFQEVTIGEETFKPIDKFDNFQMVTNDSKSDLSILGLKYTKQLIIASDDIPSSIALNIDSFTLSESHTADANIKMVLSINKGKTWKTYNASTLSFEDLTDIIIPLKPYSSLSSDELQQWDNANNVIYEKGIPTSLFNTLDFNLLNSETIRFAYVLSRPTFADTAETSELKWQFDAKGSLRKMTDNEHYVDVYEHQIKVTPLIDNALLKVNVMV